MNPLFLIGMPGSGKTTLGRALAKRLGLHFYDLDSYIESRFHTNVPEMFVTVGEAEFRRRESAMLREVGEMEDVVVACGGGTPCHSGNLEYMNNRGISVCLEATEPVLLNRILRAKSRRPMFAGYSDPEEMLAKIRALRKERSATYGQATFSFPSDELENRKMIDHSVDRFINEILTPKP